MIAVAFGFEADQLARQIVAASLGPRRERVRRSAVPRGHTDVGAVIDGVSEVGAPFHRDDADVDARAFLRHHAERAGAAEHERAQISRLHLVRSDDFTVRVNDLFECVGNFDLVDLGRLEQAARVIGKAEMLRALRRRIDALPFEHGRAVMQRVRSDVHGRFVPGLELAVVPDELCVCHVDSFANCCESSL